MSDEEDFKRLVRKSKECWIFIGRHAPAAKSIVWRGMSIQQRAYQLFVGDVPEGMIVRVSCHDPFCVAPAHMFLDVRPRG